jgi:hypothetical protein
VVLEFELRTSPFLLSFLPSFLPPSLPPSLPFPPFLYQQSGPPAALALELLYQLCDSKKNIHANNNKRKNKRKRTPVILAIQ